MKKQNLFKDFFTFVLAVLIIIGIYAAKLYLITYSVEGMFGIYLNQWYLFVFLLTIDIFIIPTSTYKARRK